jgi:LPXTG-site transpeptidase (sortase) family protein
MQPGDSISVYFENTRYNYKVDHTVIKDPNDVDLLIHSQVPGKEQLILQTCWPPGTTWKRLFVVATPEKT